MPSLYLPLLRVSILFASSASLCNLIASCSLCTSSSVFCPGSGEADPCSEASEKSKDQSCIDVAYQHGIYSSSKVVSLQ